jgi:hypothetical protein
MSRRHDPEQETQTSLFSYVGQEKSRRTLLSPWRYHPNVTRVDASAELVLTQTKMDKSLYLFVVNLFKRLMQQSQFLKVLQSLL